jgi:hypothetical protein
MEYIQTILQVAITLGILNVWLIRRAKPTRYRGGRATTIREEFAVYGLPSWAFYAIGALKILSAIALLFGIWLNALVLPAASVLSVLMFGAITMHIKVADSLIKSLPAAIMLAMCLCLVFLA